MNSVEIDVVIVNFNGGAYIKRCLNALKNQRVRPRKIVIVDNASSDKSAELIVRNFADVTLLPQQENIGFAAANNRAFEYLQDCHWVALLNPDTEVAPDWIEQLALAVQHYPLVDMFSCRLINDNDNQLLDGTGDVYHVSGLGWRRDHGNPSSQRRPVDQKIFSPCAAAAMYNMESVRRAGCFDERYFCYNEDTDLAFRMRLNGARCVHLDRCEVKHVGSGITGSDSDFTVYYGHRNLVWTYFKNMPSGMLWRYLPQHLLLNLVTILMYTLKGRPGVILRAKWHAFKGLPSILRERKKRSQERSQEQSSASDTGCRELREAMADGLLTPYFFRRR